MNFNWENYSGTILKALFYSFNIYSEIKPADYNKTICAKTTQIE